MVSTAICARPRLPAQARRAAALRAARDWLHPRCHPGHAAHAGQRRALQRPAGGGGRQPLLALRRPRASAARGTATLGAARCWCRWRTSSRTRLAQECFCGLHFRTAAHAGPALLSGLTVANHALPGIAAMDDLDSPPPSSVPGGSRLGPMQVAGQRHIYPLVAVWAERPWPALCADRRRPSACTPSPPTVTTWASTASRPSARTVGSMPTPTLEARSRRCWP